jgi:plastocyanin domain-containing protein
MKVILLILFLSLSVLKPAKAEQAKAIEVSVTEKGFEPNVIKVRPGDSVTLTITRKTDATCATMVQVPTKKIKKDLPLNTPVTLSLGIAPKGEIRFGCGMNMMEGARVIAD